jgi:hypothetical protein
MKIHKGDGTSVEAEEILTIDLHERWSTVTLANGDTIRMRPAITQVFAIPGEKDPDGNQMYVVRSQNLMVVQQRGVVKDVAPEETTA